MQAMISDASVMNCDTIMHETSHPVAARIAVTWSLRPFSASSYASGCIGAWILKGASNREKTCSKSNPKTS